jgi:hypothetical protein
VEWNLRGGLLFRDPAQRVGESMKSPANPNTSTENNWQKLGEIELRAGHSASALVEPWLLKTLRHLELHTDLISKIARSAQQAVSHATQPEEGQWLIHLLVFVPAGYVSNGHIWGFFRIEKMGMLTMDEAVQRRVIEFYLYLEG